MVAAATIRIIKIAWVTYLDALSRPNAILIPSISAHPPFLANCKANRPWALFCKGTLVTKCCYLDLEASVGTQSGGWTGIS